MNVLVQDHGLPAGQITEASKVFEIKTSATAMHIRARVHVHRRIAGATL